MFAEKVHNPHQPWIPLQCVLGLHATCRQIYAESEGIFWSKNQFLLDGVWLMPNFARGLDPNQLRHVSCIGILDRWTIPDYWTAEQASEDLLDWKSSIPADDNHAQPRPELRDIRAAIQAVASLARGEDYDLVIDDNGQLQSNLDCLSEPIMEHRRDQQGELFTARPRWRIEFETFLDSDPEIIWLTNRPESSKRES
ncbi:MAG: hypothetical protein Q9216_003076 [Gyalolechia sp. 2 TL-2023]